MNYSKQSIDIYLIGGQSNAAGCSRYDEALCEKQKEYEDGFSHIYYAGTACSGNLTTLEVYSHTVSPTEVRAGFGKAVKNSSIKFIGPELGMAEVLSKIYNEESGRYAGFLKYAVGGTRLLNGSAAIGSWASPSYRTSIDSVVSDVTISLYENFIEEVRIQMDAYRDRGFHPIIKGMYWMQGEADRLKPEEYEVAFRYFVDDVRKDLTAIMGQDLSVMPILVGEISRSFYIETAPKKHLTANKKFIELQNKLCNEMMNCHIVRNSSFDMQTYDELTWTCTTVGTDSGHWNAVDCITIGKLVGEKIIELKMCSINNE